MDEAQWRKRLKESDDKETRLAFADWLEEQGRRAAAARQREFAGVSEVLYGYRTKRKEYSVEYGPWRQIGHMLNSVERDKLFYPDAEITYHVYEKRVEYMGEVTLEQLQSPLKG